MSWRLRRGLWNLACDLVEVEWGGSSALSWGGESREELGVGYAALSMELLVDESALAWLLLLFGVAT
jgi:hypothetical protein